MRFSRRMKQVHNILGLVLGVQLLFWFVSGLFFTLFPIEQIRGSDLRQAINHGGLALSRVAVDPSEARRSLDGAAQIKSAELRMFFGEPVWSLKAGGKTRMVSAVTGDLRSPITPEQALRVAREGIDEKAGVPGSPVLLTENPLREYTGPLPAYVVDYDPGAVRVYVDANTGRLVTIRSTKWRIFDVLWRFHIMDVTGEDRFDTWWLKLVSFFGLAMVLTGLILVVRRVQRGTIFQ